MDAPSSLICDREPRKQIVKRLFASTKTFAEESACRSVRSTFGGSGAHVFCRADRDMAGFVPIDLLFKARGWSTFIGTPAPSACFATATPAPANAAAANI